MDPKEPDQKTSRTCSVVSRGLMKIVVSLSGPLTQQVTIEASAYAAKWEGNHSGDTSSIQIPESLFKLEQID